MTDHKKLLAIVELGGYPDFTPLYRSLGFDVAVVNSTRKALAHIKRNKPDIIIAEFIFSPTYGSQLSNFEALLAGVQRDIPKAELIAVYDKKDEAHLTIVSERFPLAKKLAYPVDDKALEAFLRSVQ